MGGEKECLKHSKCLKRSECLQRCSGTHKKDKVIKGHRSRLLGGWGVSREIRGLASGLI